MLKSITTNWQTSSKHHNRLDFQDSREQEPNRTCLSASKNNIIKLRLFIPWTKRVLGFDYSRNDWILTKKLGRKWIFRICPQKNLLNKIVTATKKNFPIDEFFCFRFWKRKMNCGAWWQSRLEANRIFRNTPRRLDSHVAFTGEIKEKSERNWRLVGDRTTSPHPAEFERRGALHAEINNLQYDNQGRSVQN